MTDAGSLQAERNSRRRPSSENRKQIPTSCLRTNKPDTDSASARSRGHSVSRTEPSRDLTVTKFKSSVSLESINNADKLVQTPIDLLRPMVTEQHR